MLWSWEPSTGWKKTSASLVTSRARTPNVSVQLLKDVFFLFFNYCAFLAVWPLQLRCPLDVLNWAVSGSCPSLHQESSLTPSSPRIYRFHFYPCCTHSCHCLLRRHTGSQENKSSLAGGDERQLHPVRQTVGALSGGQSSSISTPWCANVTYTHWPKKAQTDAWSEKTKSSTKDQ